MPQIKVVVFGRGNGESILVELESDHWMVVDCLVNPKTGKPAPESYLIDIGLDPKKVLKTVIISHFHADHIRGMPALIKNAHPDAKVYFPAALTQKEALTYYSQLEVINGYEDVSKVQEINEILAYLDEAGKLPLLLTQDRTVFENDDHEICALSPSDRDVLLASESFLNMVTDAGQQSLSANRYTPNHFCAAINIRNKNSKTNILLGGDLEICIQTDAGWEGAMGSIKAPSKNSIQVFKVPHHGSETAYHEKTWDDFVQQDALAMITTFNSCELPREEYIAKFKTYTNNVMCATSPKYALKQVLAAKAQKILSKQGSSIKVTSTTPIKAFGYIEGLHSSTSLQYSLHGDATNL